MKLSWSSDLGRFRDSRVAWPLGQ